MPCLPCSPCFAISGQFKTSLDVFLHFGDATKTMEGKLKALKLLRIKNDGDKINHKEVQGMDLSNFKAFQLIQGEITTTFSSNGLYFSQAAVMRLDQARYVRLMINYDEKVLAIVKTTSDDLDATIFYRGGKSKTVRWNTSNLKDEIVGLTNWDISKYNYKITGNFDRQNQALIFKLQNARRTEAKTLKK